MSKNVNEQNPSIYDKGAIKQSQLPPALRKPVPTATVPPVVAARPTISIPWEPMKPGKPLLGPKPPTLGSPANTPKPATGGTITRTPSPPSRPNPRIANLEGRVSIFEGTFSVEGGASFSVETALTGNGPQDKASLVALARKKYPKSALKLASTRIFNRELGAPATFPVGATMSQLFGPAGSPTESSVEVGSVFFQGERCQITLRSLRSRNSVTVALRPPGGGSIVFSNQIGAGRLANELAYVVKEVLGNEARELEISLKEAK